VRQSGILEDMGTQERQLILFWAGREPGILMEVRESGRERREEENQGGMINSNMSRRNGISAMENQAVKT